MRPLLPLLPLWLAACAPTADLDLTLAQSPIIPTVFTASIDGAASGLDSAWVEFGRDGDFSLRAPLDAGADLPWEVPLLGMKPLSDYEARIGVQVGGETYTGRAHDLSTGGIPAELPDFSLVRSGDDGFDGFLVTSILGIPTAAAILDQDGEYVWWYLPEGIEQVGRAVLSLDGRGVIAMDVNPTPGQNGSFVRISWDGTEAEATDLPWGHHDFYEHADGTIAYLAADPMDMAGTEVAGATLVERAPDGSTTTLWDIWDHLDLFTVEATGGDPLPAWPHVNALDYLPEEDAYLASFLMLDAIVKIDRASGDIVWVLGGESSDFFLPSGETAIFTRTHQVHRLDDSLLVFVNGPLQGGESYAVELALDETDPQVEPLWEYRPDPALNCITMGDVHRFDGGHTLVTFSYSGQIHEVAPEGGVVWKLSSSVGGTFGYVTPANDLYAARGR